MIPGKQVLCLVLILNTVSVLSRILKPSELKPKYIVETTSGLIQGTIAGYTSGKNRTIYRFQGIPYAEPPDGNLRFEVKCLVITYTSPPYFLFIRFIQY